MTEDSTPIVAEDRFRSARDAHGNFAKGCAPGPGRPPGSLGGRAVALRRLDEILAKKENIELLAAALEAALRSNPLGFFKTIVMPLLPRQLALETLAADEGRALRLAIVDKLERGPD